MIEGARNPLTEQHPIKELRTLTIDPEFRDLIPPLTDEERAMLEASILKEGCESPLTVWNGAIVDGHNRYEICHMHDIPFSVSEKEFESREDALLWIITNQLGRRNLTSYQKGVLALKFEPLLKQQARIRQATSTGGNSPQLTQNSAEAGLAGESRRKLAQIAGVSHDTIHKVKKLTEAADDDTKHKLRSGEISINRAYTELMHREHADETKVCDRCGQERAMSDFAIPSNRHGFSALCRSCEKEVAEAAKQTADSARQAVRPEQTQPTATRQSEQPSSTNSPSSVAMYKGHPIHVGAPLPDRKEMFHFVEDHMRFVVNNFLAAVDNAVRLYTSGMATPENTQTLREILTSAADVVETLDEHVKEMDNQ
ncbi:MAG: hypothetical protein GX592_00285 [Clostridiales bacterium]|nr:hypothetical protein [Clostridiales bacterium]